MNGTVAIVGAGHAAGELATGLRQAGYAGSICLIGEEPYLPYQRPPLSKTFLAGDVNVDSLLLKPQSTYDMAGIETVLGQRVDRIDRSKRRLALANGQEVAYDQLVLATGGRPRRLEAIGIDRAEKTSNFHYLRTVDDVRRIKTCMLADQRLVIVGGGYVGLEVAAVARKCGMQVTVLEAQSRVLARVTAPAVSSFYERVHREAGVHVITQAVVEEILVTPDGVSVSGLRCHDGSVIEADVVIVGIGLVPNTELASEAGLDEKDGILVDAYCRTSDPNILAIGDCTRYLSSHTGTLLRLESVPNAVEQARTAALTLTGTLKTFDAVPWFWSEQYGLRLQMAGLSQGYDQLAFRGNTSSRSFSVFYLLEGRLIAADAISRPADFILARQAIARRVCPDPISLADEALPLKTTLA
jgi:3-phenylpropionate/trans-cinnamate dioxygenase ferredoxin reductase subunit